MSLTSGAVQQIRMAAGSTSRNDLAALHGVSVREIARIQRGYPPGMAKKRGYSREFKPHGDTGKRYLLDKIPAGLWSEVRAKAKRDGVSLRAQILKLLEQWIKE